MRKYFKITSPILIGILSFLTVGCSSDELAPSESFFRIYDHTNYDLQYQPIDVIETVDGFIVLAGTELNDSDFAGVQLIKIDEEGVFENSIDLDNYAIPVGNMYLNPTDSNSYFFVADPTSLQATLIGVDPSLQIVQEANLGTVSYPLAANVTSSGNLLLLSYDPVNTSSSLSEIGLDGSLLGSASYSIGPGDDVLEEVIDHFLEATNRPLPFFCGEFSSGNYYFNGFFNYSFSMVFTDLSTNPLGVVQGQSSNAGIRAAMSLGGGAFAISGFQFDDNFQLPNTTINTSETSASVDLYPGDLAELSPYTPTEIVNYQTTNGTTSYSVFAAETEGRQIVLYFYESTTGELAGVHYTGFINPFTLSALKTTNDGGLVILGTSFVAGRFERIVLNKMSESEVLGIVN